MSALLGGTAKKQLALAHANQAEQQRLLAEREADVSAVEAGQARVRKGGGRGLLAFASDELKRTFGA